MNHTPAKSSDWLDGAAVGLSGLCLLHCLALPFFAGALPMLMPFTESHLHAQMLYFAVPLSVVAIGIGYARHRDPQSCLARSQASACSSSARPSRMAVSASSPTGCSR
jgi:hypothetical protein